jgi:hypothetical protein
MKEVVAEYVKKYGLAETVPTFRNRSRNNSLEDVLNSHDHPTKTDPGPNACSREPQVVLKTPGSLVAPRGFPLWQLGAAGGRENVETSQFPRRNLPV